jgi:hypothetical protein
MSAAAARSRSPSLMRRRHRRKSFAPFIRVMGARSNIESITPIAAIGINIELTPTNQIPQTLAFLQMKIRVQC